MEVQNHMCGALARFLRPSRLTFVGAVLVAGLTSRVGTCRSKKQLVDDGEPNVYVRRGRQILQLRILPAGTSSAIAD
jgi:hypothetical protein